VGGRADEDDSTWSSLAAQQRIDQGEVRQVVDREGLLQAVPRTPEPPHDLHRRVARDRVDVRQGCCGGANRREVGQVDDHRLTVDAVGNRTHDLRIASRDEDVSASCRRRFGRGTTQTAGRPRDEHIRHLRRLAMGAQASPRAALRRPHIRCPRGIADGRIVTSTRTSTAPATTSSSAVDLEWAAHRIITVGDDPGRVDQLYPHGRRQDDR